MIPSCIFSSLNSSDSPMEDGAGYKNCYRHVLEELAKRKYDSTGTSAHEPNIDLPRSFEKQMLRPLRSIVEALWDSLPDTLLAVRDEDDPFLLAKEPNPFIDPETRLVPREFVRRLVQAHNAERPWEWRIGTVLPGSLCVVRLN